MDQNFGLGGDDKLLNEVHLIEDDSSQILNISDVIASVINTDPSAQGMFHTNQEMNTTTAAPTTTNGLQNTTTVESFTATPHVQILEQPAPKALRFRYECEGRSAGSIPGANSTVETKTYPEIQIVNYTGRAVVVVSCVTKDLPYRPHPHNLVGKEGCKKGVCTLEINNPEMKISFSNLGIQCVKKRDIDEALRVREEIRVDPFRTRFDHRNQPSSIDLNSVRLCFQVFLEGSQKGKFTTPLKPVVSEPIFDKKSMSDLVITKLSHCNAPIVGGQEMILLCEKVAKEDISVRFFEGSEDHPSWECNGEFQHSQVHKQVAIAFRTPRYHRIDLDHSVKVKVQLRRPSDGATSEALDFELLALDTEHEFKRKRQRSSDDAALNAIKQSPGHHDGHLAMRGFIDPMIKIEPRETSPYNLPPVYAGNYRVPQTTPSPQPISPPNFYPVSPAPTSPYGNLGMGNILQNQLQAPRPNQHQQHSPQQLQQQQQQQPQEQNQHLNINFQGSIESPIFQSNQISNQNNPFAPESNQWNIPNNNNNNNNNNNLNVNVNAYNTNPNNRTLLSYNNIPHSSIFNTQSHAQNPINNLDGPSTSGTNNNNNNNNNSSSESRTTLSNLLDMDTQNILNNLSGDLNSLSFSDFRSHDEPMSDSFIKLKSDLHNLGKCTTNDK